MAETRTRSRPASNPPRNRVQVAPVPMQPAGTAAAPQSFGDKIKAHPYRYGALGAGGVLVIYFVYQHFHNQSSTATSTTGSGTGTGNISPGFRRSPGGSGGGSGTGGSGGGSGGASGGGSSGNGGSTAPPVDLSGLTGLLTGIQTEIGLLGQEIASIGSGAGGAGGRGGAGGNSKVLPYSMLPGRQPVNTLPASAKTVNVPVGGGVYAVPYTGAKPNPAIISEIGTTAAANAGIATNGITRADILAAQKSVAAGAGQQAPGPSMRAAQLPTRTQTAPKAPAGSTASSQAALANQIKARTPTAIQTRPASTAPKVITTTTGQKTPVNVAGRTSIRPA